MASASSPRSPGRPRDAQADQAIRDATLELLADLGYEATTVEAVADRAGVGKATIYRRWPNKQELVLAAIDALYEQSIEVPDTGDVRSDLVELIRRAGRLLTTTRAGQILPRIAPEVAQDTPLGRAYLDTVMAPRLNALAAALERAKQRGELRPDLHVDLAITCFIGPMMFLALTRRIEREGPDLPERLADYVLEGLRPR
jgi:AcrR family transcriptional regulator